MEFLQIATEKLWPLSPQKKRPPIINPSPTNPGGVNYLTIPRSPI